MLKIEYVNSKIAILYLDRPEKLNAMDFDFWSELPEKIDELESNEKLKVVIISGKGKAFSAGLDIMSFVKTLNEKTKDLKGVKKRKFTYDLILKMQSGFNKIRSGNKVYIAAVNGYCIGAGLDMISACDIRVASKDAIFSLRETKVGIVADLGSLNRLSKIIGEGETRLMAFTGRDIDVTKAFEIKLVNEIYENENLIENTVKLAKEIAQNKKDTLEGVKKVLNYNLSHSEEEGLDYVALMNSSFLEL